MVRARARASGMGVEELLDCLLVVTLCSRVSSGIYIIVM